ncbi:unnamed protein product [Trichobilharzia regenti]|nr:unnamed protein product [Trichobilharzia regenti]
MSKAVDSDVHTNQEDGYFKFLNIHKFPCDSSQPSMILDTSYKSITSLQDCIKEFTRILPSTSNIISLAKAACSTVDELHRYSATDEQKMSQSDVNRIHSGALIITRSVQAECNLIMKQIREEWITKLKDYLNDQARFYHQIAEQIERAAQSFQYSDSNSSFS